MKKQSHTRSGGAGEDLMLGGQLCFALYSTLLGVNKVYRKILEDLDITYPQYLVMLVLWEHDRVNVSEICERLYLETPTLTPLLKRLELRGLIRRARSTDDERQVIVSLTKEGQALKQKAFGIPDCVGEAMGLSHHEISDLRRKLGAIRNNLFKTP